MNSLAANETPVGQVAAGLLLLLLVFENGCQMDARSMCTHFFQS
jgi:hypothetical protein